MDLFPGLLLIAKTLRNQLQGYDISSTCVISDHHAMRSGYCRRHLSTGIVSPRCRLLSIEFTTILEYPGHIQHPSPGDPGRSQEFTWEDSGGWGLHHIERHPGIVRLGSARRLANPLGRDGLLRLSSSRVSDCNIRNLCPTVASAYHLRSTAWSRVPSWYACPASPGVHVQACSWMEIDWIELRSVTLSLPGHSVETTRLHALHASDEAF